jgi:hypothetical protein
MSSRAVNGLATPPEPGPEQLPASPRLALAEPPAPARRDRLRPLAGAQCAQCGITSPLGLLVRDGGQACADIRWYCKDARSCTERWTAARPPQRAHIPTVSGRRGMALPKDRVLRLPRHARECLSPLHRRTLPARRPPR